jgi:uncharacterized SAM-binding protein YcdF (DUF218 family)
VFVETQSTNTRDEAVIVKTMLEPRHVRQIVLVTSEYHMRRSIGTFRAVGLHTIPAIARDENATTAWQHWTLPSNLGFEHNEVIVHEFAGIVYYRMRGWYR